MAVRLNHGAAGHASSLISAGHYDDSTPWSFSAEDGDKLLGPNGDDWTNYRQWFLGEDDGPSDQKATYSYPFGKDGKVYGQALRAIRSRASQQGATDLFDEAGRLLDAAKAGSQNRSDRYWSMKAAGNTGEILLYQDIGQGGFFNDATSAEGFAKDLKALGKVSLINCRINSPGGSVFEGMTIYNLLASHPARVICHIDGLAASIASVVAMAGDEINIADNGMMMIHDAWGVGVGTADELRKTADVLDSITGTIAQTYAKRSKNDIGLIRGMMGAETWMTADQAKDYGLVDSVVDNMQAQACVFDPRRFRNTPRQITERIEAAPRRDRYAGKFEALQTDLMRVNRRLKAA